MDSMAAGALRLRRVARGRDAMVIQGHETVTQEPSPGIMREINGKARDGGPSAPAASTVLTCPADPPGRPE